jgi:roadblock/LC7 domain-containing protein
MPFSKIKLTRLTSSGSAWGGIISPDGKYLCYIQRSPQDQLSMNLRQLATDTEIVLLTLPEKAYFTGGRRFSDDGNYIYYVTSSSNKSFLYRMPVLGGISQKLVDDIDYIPAISPDGKKIAFTREVEEKCILMIANVDGSNQQKLKTATALEYYTDLEWSPDGKMLVAILLTKSGGNKRILSIDAKDGSVRTLIDLDTSELTTIWNGCPIKAA